MHKDFKAINHGTGQIDLSHLAAFNPIQMRPVELHLKEDGTVDDKPSFGIVMTDRTGRVVFGEISLKMLREGFQELGYDICKLGEAGNQFAP